ncbi:MAG: hypothetical protein U0527_15825 [Candidatus Eisenbacteria bacterium]
MLFPRVSASSREEADRLTPVACHITLFLVVAAVLLWLRGASWCGSSGNAFDPVLPAFRVLLPGIVVLSLSRLLSGDLSGRAERLPQTAALGSAFLLNLGLDLLWIPRRTGWSARPGPRPWPTPGRPPSSSWSSGGRSGIAPSGCSS